MKLGELIKALEALPERAEVQHGFGEPRSYRGDYSELAFRPGGPVSINAMLIHARSALGETFVGYKGGSYLMSAETECHIAEPGELGEELTASRIDCWRLEIELAAKTKALDEALMKHATAPKLVARRPDEVPDGWSGIARINFGNSTPILLVALAKRGEFVRINNETNEISAPHIEACFDFPIAEAMTAQPPRAIPALATGQHWRNAKGDSITIGPSTQDRAEGSSFSYFLIWNGDSSTSAHHRDDLEAMMREHGFELVAGPGAGVRA